MDGFCGGDTRRRFYEMEKGEGRTVGRVEEVEPFHTYPLGGGGEREGEGSGRMDQMHQDIRTQAIDAGDAE